MDSGFRTDLAALLSGRKLYIRCGATDGRIGSERLTYVASCIDKNAKTEGSVFAFCSKSKKVIKLIFWDEGSLWCIERRIHKGSYSWPKTKNDAAFIKRTARLITSLLMSPQEKKNWKVGV